MEESLSPRPEHPVMTDYERSIVNDVVIPIPLVGETLLKGSRAKKLESEDEEEYVVNEEEEMMDMDEDDGKETGNESDYDQVPEPESELSPEPVPETAIHSEQTLAVVTKSEQKGKEPEEREKNLEKKSRTVKKVEPLIIPTSALAEESEYELEAMSNVDEPLRQEPLIDEAELFKEKKRLEKEVKKLEKKEQKKRGKRRKSDRESGEIEPNEAGFFNEIVPHEEPLPNEGMTPTLHSNIMQVIDSPAKRKGRGRGKAALAKAAAAAEVGTPQSFTSTSIVAQGNSVISRMLQSQPVAPPQSFADAASVMGHKYFGDQSIPTGARGTPPSPRPSFLPSRGSHRSPYRRPQSPGVPPYPGPRPGRPQTYHTSHHPLDPSPSGGGLSRENTPHGTPPPPYIRGGHPSLNSVRFPPDGGATSRHFPPSPQTRSPAPGNFAPYHPPPSYHYGAYPVGSEDALPPVAYPGSSYPDTYTASPIHTSESSDSKPMEEEGSGEFGGLVSYFSSQREDDLDA